MCVPFAGCCCWLQKRAPLEKGSCIACLSNRLRLSRLVVCTSAQATPRSGGVKERVIACEFGSVWGVVITSSGRVECEFVMLSAPSRTTWWVWGIDWNLLKVGTLLTSPSPGLEWRWYIPNVAIEREERLMYSLRLCKDVVQRKISGANPRSSAKTCLLFHNLLVVLVDATTDQPNDDGSTVTVAGGLQVWAGWDWRLFSDLVPVVFFVKGGNVEHYCPLRK